MLRESLKFCFSNVTFFFHFYSLLCCAFSCSQGSRLNDQRCSPPPVLFHGPTVPDEDFFSLIIRSQAKRINEQRVLLPSIDWTLYKGCFGFFFHLNFCKHPSLNFFTFDFVTCQFQHTSKLPLSHRYQTWIEKIIQVSYKACGDWSMMFQLTTICKEKKRSLLAKVSFVP